MLSGTAQELSEGNAMQYKILIVDDDANICELLRLYLEKDGFDTVVANDGEQAVEYASKYSPDLI